MACIEKGHLAGRRWGRLRVRGNGPHRNSTRTPSSALLPFWREDSTTKIDYRKKGTHGTLLLTSLLEDLVKSPMPQKLDPKKLERRATTGQEVDFSVGAEAG